VRTAIRYTYGAFRAPAGRVKGASVGIAETLRAYVESGGSQQLAAGRLFVRVTTSKYRLVQVEKLTGLDLAAHHDRLRVDIAVQAAGRVVPRP
jgi:DNA-binding PucR family transcriptional regulator